MKEVLTLAEENYLKAICHLSRFGAISVSTNAIADKIDTKASSVTDMMKKLSEKELVSYKKYQGVNLTKRGQKVAASVVRRHRLWEVFLVEHLNFSWDEVHEVAEQLEHIQSDKLINQLDAFLEYPSHDPHGDPIPDKDGQMQPTNKVLLSEIEENEHCLCVGVKNSSKEFLKYLDKHQIALGTQFKVLAKESFDESMILEVHKKPLSISKEVSDNLYVKSKV